MGHSAPGAACLKGIGANRLQAKRMPGPIRAAYRACRHPLRSNHTAVDLSPSAKQC
ncbi:hypothetical protein BSIN_4821 [Burkholderia singularis]|uniref:Uncharacterized protein n=1 Tax=Burkholderia singularis TaxID=1503053 RepID=A0A238HA70_9BURK|nr:hypothetical protein BSIN_4821 [Burkholderia singularis]